MWIMCRTCETVGKLRCYTGETSRNLHVRSKEHIKDMELNNKNSWMLKHINEEHDGIKGNVKCSWKVLRKHSKPLQRQLLEAIRMKRKRTRKIWRQRLNIIANELPKSICQVNNHIFNVKCVVVSLVKVDKKKITCWNVFTQKSNAQCVNTIICV